MPRTWAVPLLILSLTTAACLRRDGRNADCRWPPEAAAGPLDSNHLLDSWHLAADADLAEQLAIQYADTRHGLRSGHFESLQVYGAERNRCLAVLSQEAGRSHGLPASAVHAALGGNRWLLDPLLNLPYLALLLWIAARLLAALARRYPLPDDRLAWFLFIPPGSLAFALAATMLGEFYSTTIESLRIGSGHLSYRVDRLPWAAHRWQMFALVVAIAWIAAAVAARRRGATNTLRHADAG